MPCKNNTCLLRWSNVPQVYNRSQTFEWFDILSFFGMSLKFQSVHNCLAVASTVSWSCGPNMASQSGPNEFTEIRSQLSGPSMVSQSGPHELTEVWSQLIEPRMASLSPKWSHHVFFVPT